MNPRFIAIAAYLVLAGLVLGPLLFPGVVLTYDMAWTGPGWLQKIMLLGLLVTAGVGGWRLARLMPATRPEIAAIVVWLGGIILVLNPFVYGRLMGGQYLVLAGYALLPHAIAALWKLLTRPTWRPATEVAVVAAGIGWASVHTLGPLLVAGVAVTLAALLPHQHKRKWTPLALAAALATGLWLLLSLPWLMGLVNGSTRLAGTLATITPAQAEAFMTSGAGAGGHAWLAAASLQGFWLEGRVQFQLLSSLWWFWPVTALLGALVIAGAVQAFRRHDRLGLALGGAGLVAWWLGLGLAAPFGTEVSRWLLETVPGFQGYREPHKWLMLTACAYAYLASSGLAWVLGHSKGWRQELGWGAVFLPFLWAPLLLWGAAGQLRSAPYPANWPYLREVLSYQEGPVLVLPWHSYLYLDFAGRVVANPAPSYFGGQMISSSNAELPGLPDTAAPGSLNRFIEDDILAQQGAPGSIPGLLVNRGITRVVVLKQADWHDYRWLTSLPGFTLESETDGWQLWRVEGRL